MDVVHPRCAGIDISKKDAKVCVRIQGRGNRRTSSTVTTWGAMTNQILALREHLLERKVTCVVMEATSNYWRPFYYLLEELLEVMLVNAHDVRTVPGRNKQTTTSHRVGQLSQSRIAQAIRARESACSARSITTSRDSLMCASSVSYAVSSLPSSANSATAMCSSTVALMRSGVR